MLAGENVEPNGHIKGTIETVDGLYKVGAVRRPALALRRRPACSRAAPSLSEQPPGQIARANHGIIQVQHAQRFMSRNRHDCCPTLAMARRRRRHLLHSRARIAMPHSMAARCPAVRPQPTTASTVLHCIRSHPQCTHSVARSTC